MSMKKTDLEKLLGKKLAGDGAGHRGGQGMAVSRREQALARKREMRRRAAGRSDASASLLVVHGAPARGFTAPSTTPHLSGAWK
jgi:hypothetical protein